MWKLADAELREAAKSWQEAIAAKEAPLSARARDLLVTELDKDLELLRREERSCVREFSRLGNELRKLQKEAVEQQAQAKTSDQPSQAQSEAEDAGAGDLPADCSVDLRSTRRLGALAGDSIERGGRRPPLQRRALARATRTKMQVHPAMLKKTRASSRAQYRQDVPSAPTPAHAEAA